MSLIFILAGVAGTAVLVGAPQVALGIGLGFTITALYAFQDRRRRDIAQARANLAEAIAIRELLRQREADRVSDSKHIN